LDAARFCHRPLYFDDPYLERFGCRYHFFQPAASAAHFFGSALLLPLEIWHQPCYSRVRVPPPICN
jgi:hypothetical protein